MRREVSKAEAMEMFQNDEYKLDLISDLEDGIRDEDIEKIEKEMKKIAKSGKKISNGRNWHRN